MAPLVTFAIPPSAPRVKCRSCGHPIVWIVTGSGRRMPVDAVRALNRRLDDDTELPPGRGESHFATCPHANDWRKER